MGLPIISVEFKKLASTALSRSIRGMLAIVIQDDTGEWSSKTYAELEEMTQEDIDRAREAQEREAENPYSKDKMKNYLEALLGDRTEISSEEVPMKSKRDLLSALSAVAYGSENGYEIQAEDGYLETQQMLLRRFKIERRKEK